MVYGKKCAVKRPTFSCTSASSSTKKPKVTNTSQMTGPEENEENKQIKESRNGLICDFCLGGEDRNRDGMHEKMLYCVDCSAKAHPSCMKYSKALAHKASTYAWQCIECKTCTVCSSAEEGDSILFCDACDKAYHMNCHDPEVTVKPEGNWLCASCLSETTSTSFSPGIQEGAKDMSADALNGIHETTLNSEAMDSSNCESRLANGLTDDTFHDDNFVHWTAGEVAAYFERLGFSKQASVFVKEEIDGRALLLLRRTDIVSGLSLKLGPAVKIYRHVLNLQSRNSPLNLTNGFS